MAAGSVKTAFHLPIGFNEDFMKNLRQKVFRNIHRKRPVLKCLFNKVSGLQSADSNTGVFL